MKNLTWLLLFFLLPWSMAITITTVPATPYQELNMFESGFFSFIGCHNDSLSNYVTTLNLDFTGTRPDEQEPFVTQGVNLPYDKTLERDGYAYAVWSWRTGNGSACVEIITRVRNRPGLDFSRVWIEVVIKDADRIRVDEGQYFDVVLLQEPVLPSTASLLPSSTTALQDMSLTTESTMPITTGIGSSNSVSPPSTTGLDIMPTTTSVLSMSTNLPMPVATNVVTVQRRSNVAVIASSVVATAAAIVVTVVLVALAIAFCSRRSLARRVEDVQLEDGVGGGTQE